ncbi:MAG: NifU family protein [Dehalococcoidia bacterium]|nr:NifU family protein [Dehalococcoidia bacterium]
MSVEAVQEVLDEIRPAIRADGGNVELLEITDDGIVKLEMVGACAGCPMATMTLRAGIERLLFERIPDIVGVEAFSGGQAVGDLGSF